MSNKDDVLKELDDGFAGFKTAVSGLSDAQMAQTMLGEWGVKDILAHVAGWHNEMAGALQRMGRGERPTPEGVDYSNADPWNAGFASAKKALAPGQMVQELDASFRTFREATAALPEDRFEPNRTVDRIVRTSGINHYTEHGTEIREWRKSL